MSIDGYEISPEQKCHIGIIRDHLHYIKKLIERLDMALAGIEGRILVDEVIDAMGEVGRLGCRIHKS